MIDYKVVVGCHIQARERGTIGIVAGGGDESKKWKLTPSYSLIDFVDNSHVDFTDLERDSAIRELAIMALTAYSVRQSSSKLDSALTYSSYSLIHFGHLGFSKSDGTEWCGGGDDKIG